MSVAKSNSENKKGVSLFKNGLKTEMLLVGILVILYNRKFRFLLEQ